MACQTGNTGGHLVRAVVGISVEATKAWSLNQRNRPGHEVNMSRKCCHGDGEDVRVEAVSGGGGGGRGRRCGSEGEKRRACLLQRRRQCSAALIHLILLLLLNVINFLLINNNYFYQSYRLGY